MAALCSCEMGRFFCSGVSGGPSLSQLAALACLAGPAHNARLTTPFAQPKLSMFSSKRYRHISQERRLKVSLKTQTQEEATRVSTWAPLAVAKEALKWPKIAPNPVLHFRLENEREQQSDESNGPSSRAPPASGGDEASRRDRGCHKWPTAGVHKATAGQPTDHLQTAGNRPAVDPISIISEATGQPRWPDIDPQAWCTGRRRPDQVDCPAAGQLDWQPADNHQATPSTAAAAECWNCQGAEHCEDPTGQCSWGDQ